MTTKSPFIPGAPLFFAISLSLGVTFACGGSGADPSAAAVTGGGSPSSGPVTGGAPSGAGGTTPGGSANAPSAASTGGAPTSSAGGASATSSGGAVNACAAGTALEGGGADACPSLPYRCVDRTLGNPAVHLAGAECSPGATGACCNANDKCLVNTTGAPGAQSAVEVAIGPCQAGCIANPSADACLACIDQNLASAGHPELSSGCGKCFTSMIACSFTNCVTPCLAGASTPACRECVFGHCIVGSGQFNECSGTLNSAGM